MLTALEFTEVPVEEASFRAEIREFLNEALKDVPSHVRARSWMGVDDEFSRKLARRGWLGLTIPKEYGGSGKGFFSRFVLSEELLAAEPLPVKRENLGSCQRSVVDAKVIDRAIKSVVDVAVGEGIACANPNTWAESRIQRNDWGES